MRRSIGRFRLGLGLRCLRFRRGGRGIGRALFGGRTLGDGGSAAAAISTEIGAIAAFAARRAARLQMKIPVGRIDEERIGGFDVPLPEFDRDAAVFVFRLHHRRGDCDLDDLAAADARDTKIASRPIAPEDRVGEGIGVGCPALVVADEYAMPRRLAFAIARLVIRNMVELGDGGA